MFTKTIRLVNRDSSQPVHTVAKQCNVDLVYLGFGISFGICLDAEGLAELKTLISQAETALNESGELLQ